MEENANEKHETPDKKRKKSIDSGIIYISRVPTLMNVNIIRRYFENLGELGRIFLQPDLKAKTRGKRGRVFSEGWLEFQDKRIAKKVACSLNNAPIGGKKKNKWREELWNIKYLHRFKWAHLNERLAYEKAVHTQRMRAEISQAKREANFYIENAEKNQKQKRIEKRKLKEKDSKDWNDPKDGNECEDDVKHSTERVNIVRLKETEDEILTKRKLKNKSGAEGSMKRKRDITGDNLKDVGRRKAFLTKIFSGGLDVGLDVASDED